MRLITTHVDAAVDARAPLRPPPPCPSAIPPSLAATAILPPLQILRRGLEIGPAQEKGRGHQRPQDGVLHLLTLLSQSLPQPQESRPMRQNSYANRCFHGRSRPTRETVSPSRHTDADTLQSTDRMHRRRHREGAGGRARARAGGGSRAPSDAALPPRLAVSRGARYTYLYLSVLSRRVGRRTASPPPRPRAVAGAQSAKTDERSERYYESQSY